MAEKQINNLLATKKIEPGIKNRLKTLLPKEETVNIIVDHNKRNKRKQTRVEVGKVGREMGSICKWCQQ